ncbi:MAG: DUF448 domain-containing protein [Meiothermus sp.]
MPTAKHVPIRQCVACRERRPKGELLRVVLGKGGPTNSEQSRRTNSEQSGPTIDPTGRKPGRGAYICPDKPECWNEKKLRRFAGAKASELAQALHTLLGKIPEPGDTQSSPNTKI